MLNRRDFLAACGVAGAGLLAGRLGAAATAPARKPPNILFLLSDDQRWDALGCMGNPILKTPNIDGLSARGITFVNMFVTTSICAASRASFFTGQFERTHGFTFGTPPLSKKTWSMSYPALLRQAGYRTGFIGKFGVGVAGEAGPAAKLFDFWRGFPGQGHYFRGHKRHITWTMGDQAIEFLDGCKADQPFCLSVSFKSPHCQDGDPRQFLFDPAYAEEYRDAVIQPPKTATKEAFAALPKFLQTSEGRKRWQIRFSTPEKYQEMVKGYFRLIHGMDVAVGRILEDLKKRGLADNTVVIFASDNGFFLGEHGLAGKWFMYEESIRVPLIVYDPRQQADLRGKRREEMALNIDVGPTILDLAGLAVPKAMQGRSLRPLLAGRPPKDWRTDFFYEHLFDHAAIPKSEGLRTQRWSYVRYFQEQPVWEGLWDLKTDAAEERNLAADPAHQATLEALRKRCDELRDQVGGPFVPRKRPAPKAPKKPATAAISPKGTV